MAVHLIDQMFKGQQSLNESKKRRSKKKMMNESTKSALGKASIDDMQKVIDEEDPTGRGSKAARARVKRRFMKDFGMTKDEAEDALIDIFCWESSLTEDTVRKSNGKWTNRGDDGTEHGEFDTKKEADAQRKAMFASGYKGESLKEDNSKSLPPEEVLKKIFPQAKFDIGDSETRWISNPETTVPSNCDEKIIKVLKKYGYEEEKGVTMDGQYYYYRPGTHKSEGVQFNTTDVFDSLKDPRCYWDENDEYFTSKDGKICGELFGVAWFNTDDDYDDYDDPFADDDDEYESLKESYSPDLLQDLVDKYLSRYDEFSLTDKVYGEIWDEVYNEYEDESLANDVVEGIEMYWNAYRQGWDEDSEHSVDSDYWRGIRHESFSIKESTLGTRKQQLINNIEELVGEYLNGIYDDYYEPFKSDEELIDYVYSQLFDFKSDGGGHTRYGKGICDDLKYLGKDYIVSEIIRIGHDEGIVEDTIEECDNMKIKVNEAFEDNGLLGNIDTDRVIGTLGRLLSEADMNPELLTEVADLYEELVDVRDKGESRYRPSRKVNESFVGIGSVSADELIGVLGQVLDEANITDGSVLGEISDLYLELIKKSGYDR